MMATDEREDVLRLEADGKTLVFTRADLEFLNALIAQHVHEVNVFLCPLDADDEIIRLEQVLIRSYGPEWNLTLKSS